MSSSTHRRYQMAIAALTAAFAGFLAIGGPLDPPAGPVASTNKTLADVEPRIAINASNTPGDADSVFRITTSGSYYLTANVASQTGKAGIEIDGTAITIDLNGYVLSGAADGLDGVRVAAASSHSNCVRNGTVRGWGGAGINLAVGRNSIVQDVRVIACGGDGIITAGRSIIERCVSTENTGTGINAGANNTVRACAATFNGAAGIRAAGLCHIVDCVANANTLNGIEVLYPGMVTNCQASDNGANGITADSNGGSITGCSVASNAFAGIEVESDSYVLNNKCDGNGVGIHVAGSDCRVEGNNLTDNSTGLLIDLGGNLIIRNSAAGNTVAGYSIVAGNAAGPMVTAATIAVSTNPHANYEY